MRLVRLLPVALAPALVSCVWLLDFDDLQTETGNEAGAGTTSTGGTGGTGGAGTGGSSGMAGSAGAGACPSRCLDDDPCTLDGCTTDGECTSEAVLGLALDGVDETIPADAHFRTTVASAADAFYFSSYTLTDNLPEVTFYRLDANAPSDALSTIATLGGLALGDAVPQSAAGLAVNTALGRIHAFIGMQNGDAGRLWHVVLDGNYEPVTRTTVPGGYGYLSPYLYPVAANLGGDIAATWINSDFEVSLWTGALAGPARLAAGRAPMTTSLISTPEDQPLVVYGVTGGGVFVEGDGIAAAEVGECQTRPGNYLSSSATNVGIPGFWLAFWTKFGEATADLEGYITTDGRGLACSAAGCATPPLDGDCAGALTNGIRNTALVAAIRPGDPTGVVHLVQVTPAVAVADDGSSELVAGVFASASRIDFGRVPFENDPVTTDLGAVPLSSMPTTLATLAGPDWPTVAFVPPDRIAITWTQPAPVAGSELRVQRYRLCAPE